MIPISKERLYGLCGEKTSSLYIKATYKCFAKGGSGVAYFEYNKEREGTFQPELTEVQKEFTTYDDFFLLDFNSKEEFDRFLLLENLL